MGEVYIDTETTGLDPTKHAIWEVGLITAKGDEKSWMVELTNQELADADPFALQIGGFHKRHPQGFMVEVPVNPESKGWRCRSLKGAYPKAVVAEEVAKLTWGHHLVGAVVSFDEERLRLLLNSLRIPHNWHYHLIDVEALCVGYLAGRAEAGQSVLPIPLPWSSKALSLAVGVDIEAFTAHEALEDARWARALYREITSHLTVGQE